MQQTLRAQVVRIGVSRPLSAQHANPASRARSLARRLHNLLVHAQRRRRHRLKIKIRIIAARRQRLAQAALQQPLRNTKFVEEKSPVSGLRERFRSLSHTSSLRAVILEMNCTSEPG